MDPQPWKAGAMGRCSVPGGVSCSRRGSHPGEERCCAATPSPPGGAGGPWAPSLSFRFSCSGGKSRLTGQEEAPGGGGGTEAAALPVDNLSASSRQGAFPAAPKDAALTPRHLIPGQVTPRCQAWLRSPEGSPASCKVSIARRRAAGASLPHGTCPTGPAWPHFASPGLPESLLGPSAATDEVQGAQCSIWRLLLSTKLICLRMDLGPRASPDNLALQGWDSAQLKLPDLWVQLGAA